MTSRCPRCGEPVLQPRPGVLLEPEPHTLGVHRSDGSSLNSADIRAREQGHRKHWCQPKPAAADNQTALFD